MHTDTPTTMSPMTERLVSRLESRGDELARRLEPVVESRGWSRAIQRAETGGTRRDRARDALLARLDEREGGLSIYERYASNVGSHEVRPLYNTAQWSGEGVSWLALPGENAEVVEEEEASVAPLSERHTATRVRHMPPRSRTPLARAARRGAEQVRTPALERVQRIAAATRGTTSSRLQRAVKHLAAAPPEIQTSEAVRLLDRMRGTEAAVARTFEEPVAAPTPVSRVMNRADQASGRIEARREGVRRSRALAPELVAPVAQQPEAEVVEADAAPVAARRREVAPARTTQTERGTHSPARQVRTPAAEPTVGERAVRARSTRPEVRLPDLQPTPVVERAPGAPPESQTPIEAAAPRPAGTQPRAAIRTGLQVEAQTVPGVRARGAPHEAVPDVLAPPPLERPQEPEGPLSRAVRREEGRALSAERRRATVERAWHEAETGAARSLMPRVMERREPTLGHTLEVRRLAGVGEPTLPRPEVATAVEAAEDGTPQPRRARTQVVQQRGAEAPPDRPPAQGAVAGSTKTAREAEGATHAGARTLRTRTGAHRPATVAAVADRQQAEPGATPWAPAPASRATLDRSAPDAAPRLSPTARAWQRAQVLPAVAAAVEARIGRATPSTRAPLGSNPELSVVQAPAEPPDLQADAPDAGSPRPRRDAAPSRARTPATKRAAARQLAVPQVDGLGAPRALPSPTAYVELESRGESPRLARRRQVDATPVDATPVDATPVVAAEVATPSLRMASTAEPVAADPVTRAWSRWIEPEPPRSASEARSITATAVVEATRTSRRVHDLDPVLPELSSNEAEVDETSLEAEAARQGGAGGSRERAGRGPRAERAGEAPEGVAARLSRRVAAREAEETTAALRTLTRVLSIAGRADEQGSARDLIRWRRIALPSLPALEVLRAGGVVSEAEAAAFSDEVQGASAPRSARGRASAARPGGSVDGPRTATVASAMVRAGVRWAAATPAETRRMQAIVPEAVLPTLAGASTPAAAESLSGAGPTATRRPAADARAKRVRSVVAASRRADHMPGATRTVELAWATLDSEGRRAAQAVTREPRPLERISGGPLESLRARPDRIESSSDAVSRSRASSSRPDLAYLEPLAPADATELPWEAEVAAGGGATRRAERGADVRWTGAAPPAERWAMATEGPAPAVVRTADGRFRATADGSLVDSARSLERAIQRRGRADGGGAGASESTEPKVRAREGLFRALTRASKPMDLAQVLLDRPADAQGLAEDLPEPAARVVREIVKMRTLPEEARELLSGPEQRRRASSGGGSGSKSTGFTRSSARRVLGLRGGGQSTTTSNDGVGATRLMKLSQKLMGLIHLAEVERQQDEAARRVRRSDEKMDAPAPGDGGAESGPDGVTLSALQREVLEAVLRELEQVKDRRKGGPDVDLWW